MSIKAQVKARGGGAIHTVLLPGDYKPATGSEGRMASRAEQGAYLCSRWPSEASESRV